MISARRFIPDCTAERDARKFDWEIGAAAFDAWCLADNPPLLTADERYRRDGPPWDKPRRPTYRLYW